MNGAEENFIEIGRVVRPQGLHGEVKILLTHTNPELINKNSLVYIRNLRGDFLPARIISVRPEKSTHNNSFFVQFEHVDDRTDAEKIVDSGIFVDAATGNSLSETPVDSGQDYTDYNVFDDSGSEIGFVTDIIHTPAHPVLIIQKDSGQLMIPAVDEFVQDTDHNSRTIYCKNLDQFDDI